MSPNFNDPLSDLEKAQLSEWKQLKDHVSKDDAWRLPSSLFGFWPGNSAAKLVRHPYFVTALSNARTSRQKHEQERKVAAEALAAERFFDFYYYRGSAYGASKYEKRFGDRIYPTLEFFLKRNGKPDEHMIIYGYDLPIANGHDVAVVYGRLRGAKTGSAIAYCNYAMQKVITLNDEFHKLAATRPNRPAAGVSFDQEFREFMVMARL